MAKNTDLIIPLTIAGSIGFILYKYGNDLFSGVSNASDGLGEAVGKTGNAIGDITESIADNSTSILDLTGQSAGMIQTLIDSAYKLGLAFGDKHSQEYLDNQNNDKNKRTTFNDDGSSSISYVDRIKPTYEEAQVMNSKSGVVSLLNEKGFSTIYDKTKTSSINNVSSVKSSSSSYSGNYTYSTTEKKNNLQPGSIAKAKVSTNRAARNWANSFN